LIAVDQLSILLLEHCHRLLIGLIINIKHNLDDDDDDDVHNNNNNNNNNNSLLTTF